MSWQFADRNWKEEEKKKKLQLIFQIYAFLAQPIGRRQGGEGYARIIVIALL